MGNQNNNRLNIDIDYGIPMACLKIFLVNLMVLILSQGIAASADVSEVVIARDDPLKMLQTATDRVLQIVAETRQQSEPDTRHYYQKIDGVMSQIIDLDYFARGVMATYASARQYKSLTTDDDRKIFRARIDKFSLALKNSLVASYADALLVFNGERISWQSQEQSDQVNDLLLMQIVQAKSGKLYHLQYRLHKTPAGWLVQNVWVEGLNLGEAYRNQFASAAEKNKGNIDYVIDNWSKLMTKVEVEPK